MSILAAEPAHDAQSSLTTGPSVSVVVPCFNAIQTLERAIDSVLAQTRPPSEILLVDDASTDGTGELVDRLAAGDGRIRVVHLSVNRGAAEARNRAFELAQGKWIAVLDADDAYLPERLERLTAVGEATGADLVSDNQCLRDADDQHQDLGLLWHPDELSSIGWMEIPRFVRSNKLSTREAGFGYMKPVLRRSFVQQHGIHYDPTLRIAEDYDCALGCLIAGARWRVVPEAYYAYTIGRPSLSMRLHPDVILALLRASRARLQAEGLAPDVRQVLEAHHRDLVRSLEHAEFVRDVGSGSVMRALKRLLDHPDIITLASKSVLEGLAKRAGLRRRDAKWIEPAYKAR